MPPDEPPIKIPVDYVIISNNAVRTLSTLDRLFTYQMLIIDSSNSHYRSLKLVAEATSANVLYHSVPAQGFLQVTL